MIEPIAISAGLVFIAELGDKSQLLAMTLTTRYRARSVLLGSALAIIALNLISTLAGDVIGRLLPDHWVRIAAGVLFIFFALTAFWSAWKHEPDEDAEPVRRHSKTAVATVFLAFSLAELGDKTMLTAMALSTQYAWYWIWLGSSLGMMASIALAVWVGKKVLHLVPVRAVHLVAGLLFAVLGGWMLLA